ncbi:NETI motif-containing protein [Lederbergia sp. NSJ-179]|uniref:NETI motif-containing protein n=1 Tax=Lederbergia sp. NSJ-179 TaxID=2931402 RepID=UPI001FD553DD|nr:NETI motif-containing protein [Lederbergia sp. NSJ-179]MCJ7841005.1 NETI motif-containing protein [Lederbergia sp. NSJ-179]
MKKEFEVMENESIEECLERMKQEGYTPIKRSEQPIFREEHHNGSTKYIPISQKIVFQGIKYG